MATGALIAGSLLSIGGTIMAAKANKKGAQAEQKALEERAASKRVQAEEIFKRSEFNIRELRSDANSFMKEQTAITAGSGIAVGTGSPLLALEDTQDRMFKQIEINRRETKFVTDQLNRGADVDIVQGQNVRDAGKSRDTSIFLQGASGIANSFIRNS